MKVLVLSAKRWDYVRKDNNRQVQGAEITYTTGRADNTRDDQTGCAVASVRIPYSEYAQIKAAPGLYEVEFDQRVDNEGKPYLVGTDVRFVQAVNLSGLTPGAVGTAAANGAAPVAAGAAR
jgi:hypothetical protein